MPCSTLLRYIGGKSKLTHKIAPYIKVPPSGVYCEPFVGGGSVALAIASVTSHKSIRILLNDLDPEVANFWQQVVNPDSTAVKELLCRIKTCRPSLQLFDEIKASQPSEPIGRAFKFLFLNRCSHIASNGKRPLGGRGQNNPDSDIASRFKPENILPEFIRARHALMEKTVVTNLDFEEVIRDAQSDWVIYADPPYYDRDLYDVPFLPDDHARLHRLLTESPAAWVLSYQEHPAVLELYRNAVINTVTTNHSMNKRKRNELIIIPA